MAAYPGNRGYTDSRGGTFQGIRVTITKLLIASAVFLSGMAALSEWLEFVGAF